jgi:glycosyltransferase involved in cell wall biosynthesis
MVGLVHDYLLVMRGAERTFRAIADLWPNAPIYTLLYDKAVAVEAFAGRKVATSRIGRLPVDQSSFRALLPLYPPAIERLPVSGHDLVVSSSSAFAHGVRAAAGADHVCYCHSPFRYVWHARDAALAEVPYGLRPVLRRVLDRIRRWDLAASARVTHYIANSAITRERLWEFYGRESEIVHPPVEVDHFRLSTAEDYLLVVTELVRHKRVELALEAARRAGRKLRVVGKGPELERLRAKYGSATFLGRVDDEHLADLYSRCLAFVLPSVEEFGIAAVEAQAAGRPVLAVDAGGARETVVDGVTGVRVPPDSVDALAEAMRYVDFDGFDPEEIQAHASHFGPQAFRHRFAAEVQRLTGKMPTAAEVRAPEPAGTF